MIALLWISAAAALVAQTPANPAQTQAVERCKAKVADKVKGEISNFAVDDFHRVGRRIHVKGTMNVLQRPVVQPGEMTPTHVLVLHYAFDCRVDGHRTPRISVSRLDD